ncbi:MAG TPA: DinB family protein [Cyclobacteriaceae bacterium]|nr:DinB family protein [Cyclobacteriaceae bacterium]
MTTLDICLLQWDTYNNRMQKVLDTISDENFNKPVVVGANSPSWILGHLADTDDKLLELFGIRKRLYPELEKIYHHERGTNQSGHLPKAQLITQWKAILAELNRSFKAMSESDWHGRHLAVSEEDFKKEPHRNKLNVMLSRVSHKASHLGQVAMQK